MFMPLNGKYQSNTKQGGEKKYIKWRQVWQKTGRITAQCGKQIDKL